MSYRAILKTRELTEKIRNWSLKNRRILSVRFDRAHSPPSVNNGAGWCPESATKWLIDHDLRADKVTDDTNYVRFRQTEGKAESFATVTSGMPEGVMLTTCDTAKDAAGFVRVNGESIKGRSLSSHLSAAMPDDDQQRNLLISRIAKAADVSRSTIHLLIAGRLNCDSSAKLRAIADTISIPSDRLIAAARADGCGCE